jgi:hypothetical protein
MLDKTTILTTIYTIIDDAIKASKSLSQNRRGIVPKLSDAEVITLALYQEILGEPREDWFFRIHGPILGNYFNLNERSRYNRRKRDLWKVILAVRMSLLILLQADECKSAIIDSAPIPCVGYKRNKKTSDFTDADYGRCISKAMKYFGYKFHSLVSLTGVVIDFMLSSAAPYDNQAVIEFLGQHKDLLAQVLGDKAYNDKDLQDFVLEHLQIQLWAPRKNNQPRVETKFAIKAKNKIRLMIETVNAQLQEQFTMSKHYAKSRWGLFTRLAAKVTAHTIGILINKLYGRPSLALASLAV